MSTKTNSHPDTEIDLPCLCALVRKAGRVLTQQYDGFLKESGLRVTQYSMLMNIQRHPKVTVSQLSGILQMDQTTVTRNLKVLEKLDYVNLVPDHRDQRFKMISITDHGRATVEKSRPSWEAAQKKVAHSMGLPKTKALIESLQQLIES